MTTNLLITLGDSWTAGVGCYTDRFLELVHHFKKPVAMELYNKYLIEENENRFYEFGWPKICKDMLGYDLLNLAKPAASNTLMAKTFIHDQYANFKNSHEKVVVVFLLTDPYRHSIFTNSTILNISTRGFRATEDAFMEDRFQSKGVSDELHNWYINEVVPIGALNETIFNLRSIEYFCKACGYEFYWGTAFTPVKEIFDLYKSDNCLHSKDISSMGKLIQSTYRNREGFAACQHPNEKGHSLIGKYIAGQILLRN